MGIRNLIKKAGAKAANTINKLSALSPDQLEHVEQLKEAYLSDMPDPNDSSAVELTNRLLAIEGVEIFNAYLPQLKELYVPIQRELEYNGEPIEAAYNIRCFNITKWVTDKSENSLDKLINIYQVLSNEKCNIALIFNRTMFNTYVYLAVLNTSNSNNNVDIDSYKMRLAEAIRGNCPGSEISECDASNGLPCFDTDKQYSVAIASNIPTEKSQEFISQTIEKLLDGTIPQKIEEEYTLVLLANPILNVEERKLHLADIYSALAPYSTWQTNYTYTENDAIGSTATFGVNAGVSAGVQNGANHAVTNTEGTTDTNSQTRSKSTTKGESTAKGETVTKTKGGAVTATASAGTPFGSVGASLTGYASKAVGKTITKTISKSVTEGISNTASKALSHAKGITEGVSRATNFGANFGANFARASSVTATIGKGEGITQTFTNYNIQHALELLETQMKRYEKGTALGMWDFAAYVLSEDVNVANNVAHTYTALTQGEESYMSHTAINVWRGDLGEGGNGAQELFNYIKELRHPVFGLNPQIVDEELGFLVYPSVVDATTALSGKELAYSLNFPRKSVAGLPVLECVEFGRNIVTYDGQDGHNNTIRIGNVFHMNHEEPIPVNLSKDSLASHTFITGSTGSGKSNTIYQLLSEASAEGVKFLVVEPAKGEYKNVFGKRDDVKVLGTNPKIMPLLKINPFSFSKNIHVLEHIDRLVELFNVCWPMYAAMPAILKNAVEKSYEDCGWDLASSENNYDDSFYPNFADVARNVKHIIESSEYDSENKGAYKGSLLTRLQSLTNGINGMIFAKNQISEDILFDSNVIVDLSRVGSSETKSLLMGMMVLKLQEYRISSDIMMNSKLRHITVLEEAHNILKRTSTDQPTEGSNLLGKSVEMISNAIAEMRTYGEGFIIADQAPGLLDMAAIRNTNTKIIMRLPDQTDREIVGLSANLSNDQITELAKLPCGVGAIYQNEWIQPILCRVKKYETDALKYSYTANDNSEKVIKNKDKIHIAKLLSKGVQLASGQLEDEVKPLLKKLDVDASIQVSVIRMLNNPSEQPRMTKLATIYNALFPEVTNAVKTAYSESHEPIEWTRSANDAIKKMNDIEINDLVRRDMIQCAMTFYLLNIVGKQDELKRWSELGGLK